MTLQVKDDSFIDILNSKIMIAIIKTGGKQYIVEKGDELLVEKIKSTKQGKVTFPDVLMTFEEKGSMKIGTPRVSGVKVEGKVTDKEARGDKVRIVKFKAKKRYSKTQGHRQQYTKVKIEKIG